MVDDIKTSLIHHIPSYDLADQKSDTSKKCGIDPNLIGTYLVVPERPLCKEKTKTAEGKYCSVYIKYRGQDQHRPVDINTRTEQVSKRQC